MREFAKQVITQTAGTLGLSADSVMNAPDKQSLLLPTPRIELEYMTEDLTRSFKRVARFPTPSQEVTHRSVRKRIYKCALTVRAVVRSDDEDWLAGFVKSLLVELPVKVADDDNNLVTIKANKAVRGGFEKKMVEVFKKRSNTLHIVFSGMICRDDSLPVIREVDVRNGLTINI